MMRFDYQSDPRAQHSAPWWRQLGDVTGFARLAGLAACLLWCVGVQASPATFPEARKQAFITAMSNGDAETVFRIVREQGMGPFWMALYRNQLEYRFPELLAMSRQCRDDAMKVDSQNAMEEATVCEGFMMESTRAMGDARGFFSALAWNRSKGIDILAKLRPGYKPVFLVPKQVDVAKLAESIPDFSAELISALPVNLPYANVAHRSKAGPSDQWASPEEEKGLGQAFRPEVTVLINGHRVRAQIDSGTSDALVMSAARAKALGLQPLVAGVWGSRSLGKPPIPHGSGALFLVKRLRLGPLRERNVMAYVIPAGYELSPGVTIGLPLLARFNSVAFRQSGMTLNATPVPCRHSLPVTYAALSRVDGLLVFTAEADGIPIRAMIDTGAPGVLMVGRRLMPKTASEITPFRVDGKYPARFIRVKVPGLGALDFDALMLKDMPSNLDADFGFPLSWGMKSVHFDFANMSICLVPPVESKTH